MNKIFTIITILMFAFLGAQTKKKRILIISLKAKILQKLQRFWNKLTQMTQESLY